MPPAWWVKAHMKERRFKAQKTVRPIEDAQQHQPHLRTDPSATVGTHRALVGPNPGVFARRKAIQGGRAGG